MSWLRYDALHPPPPPDLLLGFRRFQQEYDSRRGALVGQLLVAKNSKRSSGPENDSSAETAAEIQAEVTKISDAFNSEVQKCLSDTPHERKGRVDRRVWEIEFLACSVYRCVFGPLAHWHFFLIIFLQRCMI